MPIVAPIQSVTRKTTRIHPVSTRTPNAVPVPAMRKKIMLWSRLRMRRSAFGDQLPR